MHSEREVCSMSLLYLRLGERLPESDHQLVKLCGVDRSSTVSVKHVKRLSLHRYDDMVGWRATNEGNK